MRPRMREGLKEYLREQGVQGKQEGRESRLQEPEHDLR